MEIYKQREYDVRNIIDDISGLSGLFENYVEKVNEFIDYLLEDTKEINTLKQELQRKDNIINDLKNGIKELDNMFYETFRISQDGYFSISEWELKDFTDKIKELEEKE